MARILPSISNKNTFKWRDLKDSLRYIPRFFKKIKEVSPALFYTNLILRLLQSIFPVSMLWVGKLIIDEIIALTKSEGNTSLLWTYVAIEIFLVLLSDLFSRGIGLTDGFLGDLYANSSSLELIRKTSEVELAQLEDPDFYDQLERARQQTTGRVGLLSDILAQGQDIITVASLITGMIYFEPWLIILLLVAVLPSFINELKFSQQGYSLSRSWTTERRELDYLRSVGASIEYSKEVKLFGLSDFISDRFRKVSHAYYLANRNLAIKRTLWSTFFNILGVLAYYAAYVLIIIRTIAGVITIGDLSFLSGSFQRLSSQMQRIFQRFTSISSRALYLQDYFDFLDFQSNSERSSKNLDMPKKMVDGIEFRNVSFKYPGKEEYVLRDLNFKIIAGEKMAFVGENGAGKTTLIKLILRFYPPTSGEILLDGVNIEDYNLEQYQTFFGAIFQDFNRYNFSFKENIAVGDIREINNQSLIENAAEQSLADQILPELKNGYGQQLGRRFHNGVELSGGQWQKIALARSYMKRAEVIILDEPTSALDARAEYEAFERFIGVAKGKTAIIISHRFSTVRMADRILVLKNGSVLELGTHEELIEENKLYAELFKLQAAGYQ